MRRPPAPFRGQAAQAQGLDAGKDSTPTSSVYASPPQAVRPLALNLAEVLAASLREERMAIAARRWAYRRMARHGRVTTAEIREWLTRRNPDVDVETIEDAITEAMQPAWRGRRS